MIKIDNEWLEIITKLATYEKKLSDALDDNSPIANSTLEDLHKSLYTIRCKTKDWPWIIIRDKIVSLFEEYGIKVIPNSRVWDLIENISIFSTNPNSAPKDINTIEKEGDLIVEELENRLELILG